MRDQNIVIRRYMMKSLIYGTEIPHSVINDGNGLRQLLTYLYCFLLGN